MTIAVFVGPTLSAAEARAALPVAELLPPAKQGDLYCAVRRGATILGLIDGYFDQVESVAHKEVLWAMGEGVHVLGAASMGALRAAELSSFGMEGVGEIFAQLERGDLTDDDEVAVAHASAEHGYRRASEAMVDIRATLAAARAEGVIGPDTHDRLVRAAKALFYPDRAYPIVLSRAEAEGADASELAAFCAFLPQGRVGQKRLDALALLDRLAALAAAPPAAKQVRYFFSHTDAWETIRRRAEDLLRTWPP
jgi:hypothetical protein